ncbi:unnamed protein product [Eruca vesicaria subsp. sativa]|uniref:Uncharacterized protein n=1 Tax=Eruca vesicaria subsp. sativa TaxID=29727 RepID=A0ABC8LUD0_ERUVS|nr:unnamed protein product [Eruca vesicaria subsp. sativa]
MPKDEQEIWFHSFAQQFNWESGHTKRVRQAFNEKVMESYKNTVYEWKVAYTNKKTGEIQDPAIREVVEMVQTQKKHF